MSLSVINDIRYRCYCRPKDVTESESSCDKSSLHSWWLHHLVRRRLQVVSTVIKVHKNGFWPNHT
jgi:hypothetical protein